VSDDELVELIVEAEDEAAAARKAVKFGISVVTCRLVHEEEPTQGLVNERPAVTVPAEPSPKTTSDGVQWEYMHDGKVMGRLTARALAMMLAADQLKPEDLARTENTVKWTFLRNLPEVADLAETLRTRSKPKSNSRIFFACVAFTLLVAGVGIAVYLMMSGWNVGAGGMPFIDRTSSARQFLVEDLENWRKGSHSATGLWSSHQNDVLVNYEIVAFQQIESEVWRIGYEAVVNLTFSTAIGGRPLEQHRFKLHGGPPDFKWTIN